MKKLILAIGMLFVVLLAEAQTFPVNNLTVAGTATFAIRPTFNGNIPYDTGNLPSFASLASPVFTGVPAAPTAAVGTNTQQLATTQFVVQHSSCPSIVDYGGDPTGTNDNTAAWASTLSASPAGAKCVYFPAGLFKFSSPISYTMSGATEAFTVRGEGIDKTRLVWGATSGLTVNYSTGTQSAHIRDISFSTTAAGVGTGIILNQTASVLPNPALSALSDITNVVFRGADGYVQLNYWLTGISDSGVSNINFTNTQVWGPAPIGTFTTAGTGVSISGTSSLPPVVFNFTGCYFGWVGLGIQYGAFTQGMTVAQSNFTGGNVGINVPTGLGSTNLDELIVMSSQFNVGLVGVQTLTFVTNTTLTGNLFLVADGTNGVVLSASCQFSLVGNSFNKFSGTNVNGIVIANSICGGIISGNTFTNMASGVFLQSSSANVNVQANFYFNNTTNVTNSAGGANSVGVATP